MNQTYLSRNISPRPVAATVPLVGIQLMNAALGVTTTTARTIAAHNATDVTSEAGVGTSHRQVEEDPMMTSVTVFLRIAATMRRSAVATPATAATAAGRAVIALASLRVGMDAGVRLIVVVEIELDSLFCSTGSFTT